LARGEAPGAGSGIYQMVERRMREAAIAS